MLYRRVNPYCCSSFVPIVETESKIFMSGNNRAASVAVRSFRLWKLKARISRRTYSSDPFVAVRSFRLWKLKGQTVYIETELQLMLQFVRSDCGN